MVVKTKICSCGQVKVYAKGMCRLCYKKSWRRNNPEYRLKENLANKNWRLKNKDLIKGYMDKYKSDGRMKKYQRDAQLRKNYGITLQDYDRMLEEQCGRCFICLKTKDTTLHVDHDHKTGKVRKLLCATCNRYVGMIERSSQVFENLKNYLGLRQ